MLHDVGVIYSSAGTATNALYSNVNLVFQAALIIITMSDSNEDTPQLSAHTMSALQEYYDEQAANQKREVAMADGEVPKEMPKEDWVRRFS